MILSDGTVIPHWVSVGASPARWNDSLSNYPLRVGEVVEIIDPSDDRSASKKVIEYRVVVPERYGNRPPTVVIYPNCSVARLFGGVADKLNYTLRASSDPSTAETGKGTDGSKVLLLCLNGESVNPFILCGIRDPSEEKAETKDDGHHLEFEFNGINIAINKDGELTLKSKGATKADGTVADGVDTSKTGATVSILKDGTVNVTAPDKITIKSTGVQIGDATDSMLLASTYRQNESTLHNNMTSALGSLTAALNTLAGALTATSTSLTVGTLPAAQVALGTAVTAVISMGTAFTQMVQAIQTFEGGKYLSDKNKND